MHRFLRAWRDRRLDHEFRARIVNYADDFVILTRGRAEEALDWTRWAMTYLGLTLNETKTRLCNARLDHFDFLGYTFGPAYFRKSGTQYLAAMPSKKALCRLRGKVRESLRSGVVAPWSDVRDRLNRKLHGWSNYFSYGTRTMAYRAVDNFVLTAVQNFLQRRHKVSGRGTRRFSAAAIYGELGVLRLLWKQLGRPAGAIS